MRRTRPLLLLAVVALAGAGCGTFYKVASLNGEKFPPKSPDQVKLYMGDKKPDCDFDIVGTLSGNSDVVTASDPENVLNGIRQAVADFGGDGALNIKQAAPGNVGGDHAQTTADVYKCKAAPKTAAIP